MLAGYGSGFVYLSRELMTQTTPRAIGWLSVVDPYSDRHNEVHLRHDAAARVELGCPHFAGMFALGASIDLMTSLGMKDIEARVLELNRYLTAKLTDAGHTVLSPLTDEAMRSAETLVEFENPDAVVSKLAAQNIIVTRKPQGIRVATHCFNNEADVDRLIQALG